MYKHILVPTDGSHLSEQAAAAAIRIAKDLRARITALHVVPEAAGAGVDAWTHDDEKFEEHLAGVLESRGNEYLSTVREMAHRAGVACECVLVRGESPSAEIVVEARDRGCDLIVMASHGRRGSDAVILASETVKVMTLGELPVLVHRAPRKAAASAQAAAAG